MQLIKLTAAAALAAPALSAKLSLPKRSDYGALTGEGEARVHNRCSYPVYLWSVLKNIGCTEGVMQTLKPGESYSEQYKYHGKTGVSIKISKTEQCKGDNVDITQLEYFYETTQPGYNTVYSDCSFVDCLGNSCPSRDKFFMKVGQDGSPEFATAGADLSVCPTLKCNSVEECSKKAYVLPDDVQTRSCPHGSNIDFYLCSDSESDYSGGDDSESPVESQPESSSSPPVPSYEAPSSTVIPEPSSTPSPSPSPSSSSSSSAAAVVTPKPEIKGHKGPKVMTVVVTEYATKHVYAGAKRHAHGHRHFHA